MDVPELVARSERLTIGAERDADGDEVSAEAHEFSDRAIRWRGFAHGHHARRAMITSAAIIATAITPDGFVPSVWRSPISAITSTFSPLDADALVEDGVDGEALGR
ncbi:MAG: hypothetical protein ACLP0J_23690 [Solirubrobacteraceae bacterium]